MKHVFGKSLLLIAAAALVGTASITTAQVRTNPTLKAPTVRTPGVIISNGVAKPDLVIRYTSQAPCAGNSCVGNPPPSTHLPGSGFCGTWNGGNQKITLMVRNNGLAMSGPSQVVVYFLHSGSGLQASANVPPLGAHEMHTLQFDVPAGAWSPGNHSSYHFTLRADGTGMVEEYNEANNSQSSHCIGPAA